jgi:hypothetical protein
LCHTHALRLLLPPPPLPAPPPLCSPSSLARFLRLQPLRRAQAQGRVDRLLLDSGAYGHEATADSEWTSATADAAELEADFQDLAGDLRSVLGELERGLVEQLVEETAGVLLVQSSQIRLAQSAAQH